MRVVICWWRVSILMALILGVPGTTSQAQFGPDTEPPGKYPLQQIVLENVQLQDMLNPTLKSLQITAASSGGNVSVTLPDGQKLSRDINIGEITVPAPVPFPAVICTIKPIRNDGPPSVRYTYGRVQLMMALKPVNPGTVINTRWAKKSIFLLPPPGISVTRINVTSSFKFAPNPKNPRLVIADDLQVQVSGDWHIAGLLSGASGVIRDRINTAVATNIQNMLKKDLNLMVSVSVVKYLNSRAQFRPAQITSLYNDFSRVIFRMRTSDQIIPDGTPLKDTEASHWAGTWGDGTTAENSCTLVKVSQVGDKLMIHVLERSLQGVELYKDQFENPDPANPRAGIQRDIPPDGSSDYGAIVGVDIVALADQSIGMNYGRSEFMRSTGNPSLVSRAFLRRLSTQASDQPLLKTSENKDSTTH